MVWDFVGNSISEYRGGEPRMNISKLAPWNWFKKEEERKGLQFR